MYRFLLAVPLLALCNCAASFDLVGGPKREFLTIDASSAVQELEPRVADSAKATQALIGVKRRSHAAIGLAIGGGGLLGASLGVWLGWRNEAAVPLAIGLSVGALALEVVGLLLRPSLEDFAEVLRLFNVEYPATPWLSDALGIKQSMGMRWEPAR